MSIKDILEIKIENDDFPKKTTIKDYLKRLLETVWEEQEMFSGKRAFGNSDWCYDLYIPLIKAGVIDGELDEDGYVNKCDNPKGHKIIMDCIKSF